MKTYKCWHHLCRETAQIVIAATSWEARKAFARSLGCGVQAHDIMAIAFER